MQILCFDLAICDMDRFYKGFLLVIPNFSPHFQSYFLVRYFLGNLYQL